MLLQVPESSVQHVSGLPEARAESLYFKDPRTISDFLDAETIFYFERRQQQLNTMNSKDSFKERTLTLDKNCLPCKESKEVCMELAKLTSKGQITVPAEIRRRLKLKKGDTIFFVEDKGRIYFENSSQIALKRIQDEMDGEAEKAGFKTEEDVTAYIKNLRNKSE
ncbi:MAG: AbrB/MazE/SpoVT family DNA-binding domain-containing protein [Desulfonatronovibrio sp.]